MTSTTYDPAWLDLQYNNRARIPEHPQIFERWERASVLARERLSARLDVAYGDGPNETLDIFPPLRRHAPVLVFIHGGYWRALDKRDVSFIAPAFVQSGAMVVVPNYALCPAVSIEQITLQMVHALAWVHRNAEVYGGDSRRIVVAGHSAGGHLAAMLASCRWTQVASDLPADLVQGALSISGLFDLEPVRQTQFLQADLKLDARAVRRLSPAYFPAPAGPVYATVGGNESEEFKRQNDLLQQRWGRTVVPVCEPIAGFNHLDVLNDLVDPQGRQHALALQLLGLASA